MSCTYTSLGYVPLPKGSHEIKTRKNEAIDFRTKYMGVTIYIVLLCLMFVRTYKFV